LIRINVQQREWLQNDGRPICGVTLWLSDI